MSEEQASATGANAPTSSTAGDASGTDPSSATVLASRSGGSSSAPAPGPSASASHGGDVDAANPSDEIIISDDSDTAASTSQSTQAATGPVELDTTAGGAHRSSFREPHLLSTSEVDTLFAQGLPMDDGQPVTSINDSGVPPSWTAPSPEPEGRAFLVGIPARVEDFRAGLHLASTYGGPCVLVGYEDFTGEDIAELSRVIPRFSGDQLLLPRTKANGDQSMDALLGSIDVHKKMASILAHLPRYRLAERVFKTTGFLKVMAAAHRRLREKITSQGGLGALDAAAARNECEELKREWVLNCQYWRHELLDAQRKTSTVEDHMNAELQNLKTHYQDQVEALEAETASLKSRLADSQAQIRLLKSRPEVKATDPWDFMECLHENSEITGNWDRLQELLVHHQEDKAPSENWVTVISVAAMDKRKAPIPVFKDRLAEIKAERAAKEATKATRVLDLTRIGGGISVSGDQASSGKASGVKSPAAKPTSPGKPPNSSGTPSPTGSGKQRLRKVQDRPSRHTPGIDSVRPANAKSLMTSAEVRKSLPGGIVWEDVRPDLREALLSGISYNTAMQWLSTDKSAHSLFTGRPLVKMLVSMMYWRKLNKTPWGSYVPETYYKTADEELSRLLKSGEQLPVWEALDAHVPYPLSDAESTADDPKQDPDYKGSGGAGSGGSSESEDSESDDDRSDSGGSGSDDHTHAGSKRRRDDNSDDSDSVPVVPIKKSKHTEAHASSKSSSKSHKSGSKSKSSSGSTGSMSRKSHKGSLSKSPSGEKHRKSSLMSKPYTSLTAKELLTVDVPDAHCSS